MIEYTRKDIIMDLNDSRLEGSIGKKVYCSSDIGMLLKYANEHKYEMILTRVMEEANVKPFIVTDMDGTEYDADFIILKEEEPKPEYVPFENAEEFLNAYDYTNHSVKNGSVENKLINYGGIWLKDKETDAWFMVTEIWDEGVVVGDGKLRTVSNGDNEYFTMNDVTDWLELLRDYIFLDGTPCGKEVK